MVAELVRFGDGGRDVHVETAASKAEPPGPLVVHVGDSMTFGEGVAAGATYSVSVFAQPQNPVQTCSVTSFCVGTYSQVVHFTVST